MIKARVLIAIPNLNSVHPRLVTRLLQWHTKASESVEGVAAFMPTNLIPHDSARNYCVQHFLNGTQFTHLFFVDSDVVPPEDALETLVAADVDVVSGIYRSFKKPKDAGPEVIPEPRNNVFVYGDTPEGDYGLLTVDAGDGLVPIRRAGAGCLLIKRHVLEGMQDAADMPWFKFQYHSSGTLYYGEDIDFCAKAETAGYNLYAHFGVVCKHLKEIMI